MPWVDQELCTGCGICVDQCVVGVITLENNKAEIEMEGCIRCGVCHEICPEDAVRHDSEKADEMIRANVAQTASFMDACAKYLGAEEEKWKCLERMKKHFIREKTIAEKTLLELENMKRENS